MRSNCVITVDVVVYVISGYQDKNLYDYLGVQGNV